MAYRVIAASLIILCCCLFAGCAHNSAVCRSPYNYLYRIVYDEQGRLSQVMSTTRVDLVFDNSTRAVQSFRTAPEAPSGVLKSAVDAVAGFIGKVFGGIF